MENIVIFATIIAFSLQSPKGKTLFRLLNRITFMADLGTLWFGADIDLTNLKQKIAAGNKDIVDALKIDFDPSSFQQMVSKLRTDLSKEIFEIKIQADSSALQNLQRSLGNMGQGGQVAPFNLQNIQNAQTGVAGIHRQIVELTRQILDKRDQVKDLSYQVAQLRDRWGAMVSQYGRRNSNTRAAYNEYAAAKQALREEQAALFALQQGRSRANLTLAEQRVAYKEANEAVRQARINLAEERKGRIDATAALEREKAARKAIQAELEKERARLAELRKQQAQQNAERLKAKMAIQQQTQATRELNSESIRLNTTLGNGIHISSRLGSALSGLFAVHYVRQFLDNVIEIGGQLEKQRISMQAIIGDTARANELFEQIKGLAIKSPFGVVELDQYSKQLAAYGIEQSNLFDMTKRLADISAGAGQDIGRLALALGHVKSATYLTGITLRQFSMNNIPMLKMLADYYSEVEKRAVSTAEVQKRISKRQVSYEDVLEQIKRMTNEGGTFYNMQEKISESLSAKFKNLRDSFDIMYGEIAESKIGDALKGFAKGATELSRNWKQVITVIAELVGVFGAYRLAAVASTWATRNVSKSTIAAALSNGKLSASMIKRYVLTEQITKAQLLEAVATRKVTVADAELAAASLGVTRAQLEHIAATGRYMGMLGLASLATSRYTVAQLRLMATFKTSSLSMFTRGLAGLRLGLSLVGTAAKTAAASLASFMAPLAGFAAVSLIFDTIGESGREAEEAQQRMHNMAETANEAFKNMSEARKKFPTLESGNMTDEEMRNSITEMIEHLQNYSKTAKETFNFAFAVDEEGKAVHSLADQYEILALAIDNTTEAYRTFNEMRPMVEHALEQGNPDLNFIERLGKKLGNWLFKDDHNWGGVRTLEESLKHYIEKVKESSVAEQLFLRQHLDVRNALASNGYAEALNMDNDALLGLVRTLKDDSPEAFARFYQSLDNEGKNALNNLTTKWDLMGAAFLEAGAKMNSIGEDLFTTLSTKYQTSDMSKWPVEWKQIVYLAMDEATKHVQGFADLSIEHQNRVRDAFLQPFKITVDTDEALKQVNNLLVELQNLVGTDWVVRIGIKGESSIDDVDAATKAYKKAVEDVRSTKKRIQKLSDEGKAFTEAYLQTLKDNQEATEAVSKTSSILQAYGADLPEVKEKGAKKSGGGGKKTDEQLKRWKEQVSLLDKYRQKVEELSKLMSRADAQNALRQNGNFTSLFSVFTNPDDYIASLDEIIAKLGTTGDRGAYAQQLMAKKEDENLRERKEAVENYVGELKRMLDVMRENYDVYKEWVDLTGDRNLAARIAGVRVNTSYAELLAEEYRKIAGNNGLSAEAFFGLKEGDAKKYGEGSAFFELWRRYQDNMKKISKEDVNRYKKAIESAKGYEEKVDDINRELAEEIESIKKLATSEEQAQKLIANAEKKAQEKRSKLAWENFKETSDWGRVFGDLDKMSLETINDMIDAMMRYKDANKMTVEETKAWYEAMRKLTDKKTVLDPIQALTDAVAEYNEVLGKDPGRKQQETKDKLAELLAVIKKAAKEIANVLNQLSQALSNLGNSIGGKTGSFLNGIGYIFEGLGKSIDAASNVSNQKGIAGLMSRVSAVMTVITAMVEMNKKLAEILPNSEKLYEHYAQKARDINTLREAVDEYRRSVVAAHAAEGEWFAGNSLSNLRAEGEKAKETMTAYYKELYEAQEQYKNKSAGWKKAIVPLAAAASAVVAAFTLGTATPGLMAAWGAALSLGTVTGTLIGGAVAAGVGYAIGQIAQSAVEGITYKNGQIAARDNMRIQTRHKSFWRGQKTANLEEWVRKQLGAELFDEQGLVNLEAAQQVLDKYGDKLVGETKETLERLVELRKEYDEFIKQIEDYVGEIGTSLAESMTNAIWDWLVDGENALDKFKEYASETWKEIAQDIIKTFMKVTILDNYSDLFKELFKGWSLGGISDETLISTVAALSGQIATDFENIIPMAQKIAESLNTAFKGAGYDITGKGGSSSSRVIKGEFNENETGLVLSYMNGIRADLAMQRNDVNVIRTTIEIISQRQNVVAESQIQQLRLIADNTLRNANAADSILQILSMAVNDKSFGFNVK